MRPPPRTLRERTRKRQYLPRRRRYNSSLPSRSPICGYLIVKKSALGGLIVSSLERGCPPICQAVRNTTFPPSHCEAEYNSVFRAALEATGGGNNRHCYKAPEGSEDGNAASALSVMPNSRRWGVKPPDPAVGTTSQDAKYNSKTFPDNNETPTTTLFLVVSHISALCVLFRNLNCPAEEKAHNAKDMRGVRMSAQKWGTGGPVSVRDCRVNAADVLEGGGAVK